MAISTPTHHDQDLSPLRIVLVEFAPAGGLFQFAVQLGEGLARAGHRPLLLTGPDPELASREAGFAVAGVLPTWHPADAGTRHRLVHKARRVVRAGRHTLAWLRLLTLLRRLRPDAVVWSAWRFPLDGWFVVLAARLLPHAVLALIAHEPRPLVEQPGARSLYKSARVLRSALAAAYRRLHVVFVLGAEARGIVEDTWRPTAVVVEIPHGDESVFVRTADDGGGADVPSAAATEPLVLFFGTWTRYKGLDVLLEAFAKVRRELPTAGLVVAGGVGADVDLAVVHRRAEEVGGVELRPGYVAMAGVPKLFAAARVVAVPYLRASQSGVVHLAQTFARPVVATRVGDVPAAVPDGECGLLVPPGDTDALAGALTRLLTDPALADRMGTAGAARVRTAGSWDRIARTVARALEEAGHRPSRRTSS